MLDFGALPPEINSARMYSGPGSGPLLAAAAAWDALAAQTESFATSYSSMIAELQDKDWFGPASTAMAAAAQPYVAWALATSARAQRAGGQARLATAAFETAFAATVPPAQVLINRHQLAVLVATNFLGLNAPAIAATEALYAEMWAQDAAAMYGYAASAAAAATLTDFDDPPTTTNSAGQAAAATDAAGSWAGHSPGMLTHVMAAVPQQLNQLAAGGVVNASTAESSATSSGSASTASVLTAFSTLNTLDGPLTVAYQVPYTVFSGGSYYTGLVQSNIQAKELPKIAAEDALPTGASKASAVTPGSGPVVATAGSAEPIATLSVPQSWATAVSDSAPVVEPVADPVATTRVLPPWTATPTGPATAAPATPVGTPGIAPIANGSGHNKSNAVFRMRDRRYRIPRPAAGG